MTSITTSTTDAMMALLGVVGEPMTLSYNCPFIITGNDGRYYYLAHENGRFLLYYNDPQIDHINFQPLSYGNFCRVANFMQTLCNENILPVDDYSLRSQRNHYLVGKIHM